ncbi:MAG: LpqB family beta-propeller domain-containing protein [Ancrocorticia sp.]|uniref:LpqB family beta-propeller domain-containing protein n=1 Tax=Ancrocorticia sp. TaxID=2593684 RepID=UPI003F8EE044
MRRFRLLALLVAAVLVVSGCSSLPRSGDVHTVNPSGGVDSNVGLVGQPPAEDATPEEIVLGFLIASRAGVEDNFAVARQYLLSATSAEWDPFAQVRVYPDSQSIQTSRTSTGAVRAKVGSLGTLASDGTYTESLNEAVTISDFSLARDSDGQWRIANLDDGVLLSEHTFFSQLYTETPVYFLSWDQQTLVADLRWFPRQEAATRAVNALIAGPSPWLAEGLTSSIPTDTKLVRPVNVEDSVATVELSGNVLSLSESERANVTEQITQTVMAAESVQDVEVTAQGTPLVDNDAVNLSDYPYGSYGISLLSGGDPAVEVNGEPVGVSGLDMSDAGLEGLAVSYSSDDPLYASIGDDGDSLYVMDPSAESYNVVATGSDLVEPSFDKDGFVWTGDRSNEGGLTAFATRFEGPEENATNPVAAPWLEGMTVRNIAVSRDGSRIVVVADTGGETAMFSAGIVRNADDAPISLSEPIRVGQRLTGVSSVAWIGPTELVVLGRTSAGSDTSLYSVKVGGPTTRLASLQGTNTASMTAGRGEQSVVILTDTGTVMGRSGGAWRNITTSVDAVAFPG